MNDELERALSAIRAEAELVPIATGTFPMEDTPQGATLDAVALAALVASNVFGAIALKPAEGSPDAEASSALERAHGLLPRSLGVLRYGQTSETRRVVQLDTHAGVLRLAGDVHVSDAQEPAQVLLRPGEHERAAVRLFGRGCEAIVSVDWDRNVRIEEVVRRTLPDAGATREDHDGAALEALAATPPPLASWLEGASPQAWLSAQTTALAASPWALDHLCAVGMLERFWVPTDKATRRAVILGTITPPAQRARVWLVGRAPEALEAAQRAARREALALIEALDAEVASPAQTLHLALRRDDLESVHGALRITERGGALRETLDALDALGRARWSALPADESVRGDPRLRCVAWSEPDAWWGRLAAV